MKKILFIAIAAFCMTAVQAQENEFQQGWQLGVKAGVGVDMPNRDIHFANPMGAIDLGYKFSPKFTLRGQLSGFRSSSETWDGIRYNYKTGQASINAVFNFFTGKDHFFKPYVFVGPGFSASFDNGAAIGLANAGKLNPREVWGGHIWSWNLNGGIGTAITLSETTDFVAEIGGNTFRENYDSQYDWNGKLGIDGQLYGLVGLRFNLCGKPAPIINTTTPAPVVNGYTDEDLARVRAEAERAAAQKYAAELEAAKRAAEAERAQARKSETTTLFFIDKDKFRPDEQAKLQNVLFILKQFPEATVTVTGYADKETGNPAYNMKLSEKRANKVKDILVKAGIAENRISISAKGDTERISDKPAENRAVVSITK